MPMPTIQFKLKLFRGDWDQARSQVALLWLMEALVRQNQSHIRQFVSLAKRGIIKEPYPRLYRAGVHYEREPPGQEVWPDVPSILETKDGEFSGPWGDCEDLACWRTAELRELGNIKAKPFAKWRFGKSGNYHYHALTLLPDGRLEDPSLTLGMGREAFFAKHDIVARYKKGELKPLVMFAKLPDVVVVDPEKPTGYSGGKADYYQQGVSGAGARADELAAWGYDHNEVNGADMQALRDMTAGMGSVSAMTRLPNISTADIVSLGSHSKMTELPNISTADLVRGGPKHEREVDDDGNTLDDLIGWNGKTFVPRSDSEAIRRLMGYGKVG
jgi:hypothetical protein